MEQQRTEATESLLVRQGNDNLVYNEENGGLGDGGSVAVSDVTTILGLSTFVAACISFGSGCAVGYSSPTESSIVEDLGLSVAEFSVFGSILSIGALLGSAVSGKITDLLGRKLTMWILNLFYIGGWLAIAFTKSPWLLDLGRLSLGFTIGTFTYLMPVYISEITTKSVRGRFSVIPSLTFGWGISFMYVVGSFVSWRTLALIATIPGLLQLLPLFFIPESPRWVAKVGRDKELEDVLLCLRGNKADIFNEAAEIKDYVESLKSFSKEGILEIFQKKYVRPLLTVVGMIILMNLGGANAFAFYSGVIFVSAGLSSMVGLITLAATQTIVGVLGIILIDKLGRRPLQLVSTAGLCFSCFLTGLSFLLKLNLGRISLGFTNGISGYLAPIYIAEITTKHVRGRFTTILQVMVGSGASFMYVVGSFVHWRTLALLATIPGLLQLLLIFFIPESPRWLANVGREKELEAALLCLRGDKADISDEATEIKNHVESLKSFSRGGIVVDIFQKKYVRPLLTVVGMMVLTNLGGINAFVYYSGAIFVSAGISSMVGLITLAATQTVVGILSSTIIDKLGRRPLLLVSSAGLCFSSFLTGVTFFLKDFNWWDQGSPILAFIGLLMYMGSYALSAGLPGLLVSELFPINVKGSAGSICNFMGNSTGWVVGYYFNFLTEWSSAGIFFTFSAFCCANFFLIATMVPETKGRTLEEIQASITPSSD